VGLLALVYAAWAAYLALMAHEGALPPRSRLPQVPRGVAVVADHEQCASGGCWRELVLRPAAGTSPAELAAEMGVTEEERHGWRPSDPHTVVLGSKVSDATLSIYVQY